MKNNLKISIYYVIVFYLFIFLVSYLFGFNPFITSTFHRWDSGLYQSISDSGYYIVFKDDLTAEGSNCGWFPLLPFLAFVLKKVFSLSFVDAAFLISLFCTFSSSFILLTIVDESRAEKINKYWCLFYYLAFIGSIYLVANFPMSLCLTLIGLSFLFVLKKKYFLSGLFLFIANTSYSTAFLFCGVLGLYLISETIFEKQTIKSFIIKVIKAPLFGFMGFGFVQLIIYFYTGNFWAFFITQGRYGHGLHNPINTLCKITHELKSNNLFDSKQHFMSLLFFLLFVFITYVVMKERLYRQRIYAISYYSILIIYGFLLIIGSAVSPFRQYLLCSFSATILASDKVKKENKLLIGYIFIICLIYEIDLFLTALMV